MAINNEDQILEQKNKPRIYLSPEQINLISALKRKRYTFLADAYEAALKMIWLIRNPEIFEDGFITENMASCVITHLAREILNALIRGDGGASRVDYALIFTNFTKYWNEKGFLINGLIPEYRDAPIIDEEDVIFPKPPIAKLSEGIKEHSDKAEMRLAQINLLFQDIYGERFNEIPLEDGPRNMMKWAKRNDLIKYAHLSVEVYGDLERNVFTTVLNEFEKLELLLAAYCRDYFDTQGELDDILSKANS